MNNTFAINPRLFEKEHFERCQLKDCQAACCLYGVWVDEEKVKQILDWQEKIKSELPREYQNADQWFEKSIESDPFTPTGKVIHTRVLERPEHYGGSACIFLRTDYKCALQVTGERLGKHPWYLKPFYCILHPLYLDDQGRITIASADEILVEEGSCLIPAEKPVKLMETFAEELTYILGVEKFTELLKTLSDQQQEVD